MEDCPVCFGKKEFCDKIEKCPSCEFLESCKYCCKHDGRKINRTSGHVSLERYSYSTEIAEQPAESDEPLEDIEPNHGSGKYTEEDIINLMRFIYNGVDDYALSLINSTINRNIITASDAARVYKVSRQAIHRKLLDSCRKNPELKPLFMAALHRCKRLREDLNKPPLQSQIYQPELF